MELYSISVLHLIYYSSFHIFDLFLKRDKDVLSNAFSFLGRPVLRRSVSFSLKEVLCIC